MMARGTSKMSEMIEVTILYITADGLECRENALMELKVFKNPPRYLYRRTRGNESRCYSSSVCNDVAINPNEITYVEYTK